MPPDDAPPSHHHHHNSTAAVYLFPTGVTGLADAPVAFGAIALLGVATSLCSTLMFTAMGSFFNQCARVSGERGDSWSCAVGTRPGHARLAVCPARQAACFIPPCLPRLPCAMCRISDPSMGGTYLTLLNTIANAGITVPKLFVFAGRGFGLGLAGRNGCRSHTHPASASTHDVHPRPPSSALAQPPSRPPPQRTQCRVQRWMR